MTSPARRSPAPYAGSRSWGSDFGEPGIAILSEHRSWSASSVAKLWAGRFTEPTDAAVEAFTASVDFDRRLYRQDVAGSVAHATMLAEVGVIEPGERDAIVAGLRAIEAEHRGRPVSSGPRPSKTCT